jgi:hypothetical protein
MMNSLQGKNLFYYPAYSGVDLPNKTLATNNTRIPVAPTTTANSMTASACLDNNNNNKLTS